MTVPNITLDEVLAAIALVTAILNHFRVTGVAEQIKKDLQTELDAFKTELKADATLAAASVLADALVAGAKLKSDAKLAKDSI